MLINDNANNRSEEEDNMIANNFVNNVEMYRSRKRKIGLVNNSQNENEHVAKKKKVDSYYSNSDSEDWENIKLPMDYNSNKTNIDKNAFCFACSNIGHNMPIIQGLPIQNLLISMGTGLRTTEFNRHCENIYDQYEETIRKPTNEGIIKNKMDTRLLLPEWSVSTIREHLETHHNDPELTIELMMHRIKVTWDYVWKNGLIQKKKTKQSKEIMNQEDESDHDSIDFINIPTNEQSSNNSTRINPKQWKVVKELIDTYIKLGKSKPENMTPFYKADRYIVRERTKHTFLDLDDKNIHYTRTNNNQAQQSSSTSTLYNDNNGTDINASY